MNDKFKTFFAIIFFFLALIMPVTGLIYGASRWNAFTILLVMGAIFVFLFVGGLLILTTVQDFSWMTASLPFLFSGFYTILPDLPGSIDDATVTTAGALMTYVFALRRNETTPKWIIIPLLAAAAYTLLGGTVPGPVDEVLIDIIALLVAGAGARNAEIKAAKDVENREFEEHVPPPLGE